ncbi:MAG: hypothetical protein ACI4ET_01340, partial [Bilifractor sp.]
TLSQPHTHPGSVLLLESSDLAVFDEGDSWRLQYPSWHFVRMSRVKKNGAHCVIHIMAAETDRTDELTQLHEEVFHALRLPFLIRARKNHLYALHACSFLYHEKSWLISAPSGTGKSTHADLWVRKGWASVLNGDLNLIGSDQISGTTSDNSRSYPAFTTYGIPWCGTSGIATSRDYPVGGIILLRRGSSNHVRTLERDQRQLRILQRLITPSWNREMLEDCLNFTGILSESMPVWELTATREPSAAEVMKKAIDEALGSNCDEKE